MTCAAAMVAATSALAEDAYIESYGTGSICLGHFAGPNTKLEVDLELTEILPQSRLFGSLGNHTSSPLFQLYIGNRGDGKGERFTWECSASDGTRQAWNIDVANVGERRTVAFDASTSTYTSIPHGAETGETYHFSKACLNVTSPNSLAVFGSCNNFYAASTNDFTVKDWPVKMKCYGVRIYESGSLVKNFVPCVKGGIAGLKETINNRFMSSVNVKAVGYGGDILFEKDDPYISTAINTNSIYASDARIPGTSIYLDTGYYMKINTRLELDYALLTPDWPGDRLHGAFLHLLTANGSSQKMYVAVWGSNANRGDYYVSLGGSDSAEKIRIYTACDVRRTVTVAPKHYSISTAGYTNYSWTTSGGITSDLLDKPVRIAHAANTDSGFAPMKIYGLKIYESDALVKDFRPFVTNGVPGLIDALNPSDQRFCATYVDSTIKTNRRAEAGGDLGRDSLTSPAECEAYLEFPATGSGIDTGYKVPHNAVIEADFALWSAKSNDSQLFFRQESSPYVSLSWVIGAYWWKFADTAGGTDGFTPGASNERLQYRMDSSVLTLKRGDTLVAARTKNFTSTTTSGSATLKIGSQNAAMRLYRFKVSVGGSEQSDFVPCVTNGVAGLYERYTKTFLPLAGGRVYGKGYKGQADEFESVPQPMRIKHDGTGTLTCFATSAQSYEWYEDGKLIEGATGNSLTLNWNRAKAKASKHTYAYSVVPVYTVFNETVRGEAATAHVEFVPRGMILLIQ